MVLSPWFSLHGSLSVEQKDKTEPFDVAEVLQELPRDQREVLGGRLLALLQGVLLNRPPGEWGAEPGAEPGAEAMEVEGPVDPVSSPHRLGNSGYE